MELISSEAAPEDFFFEPIEYVFQADSEEWSVAFIPTVPHGSEADVLHGDLFECRIRDIDYETTPVVVGSAAERSIIDRLQAFADAHKSRDEQRSLRDGKFPRMSGEIVGWKKLLWFISALNRRIEKGS
jgi:hypothetical protein